MCPSTQDAYAIIGVSIYFWNHTFRERRRDFQDGLLGHTNSQSAED